ncbi:MAG: hypothetical protein HKP17_08890, partial [Ignavibacteriaceae bacterium]|nr:hypothetical protein [Ignavibacteriaceae bacterium]
MINLFQIIKKYFGCFSSKKNVEEISYITIGVFFICVLGFLFTRDIELWIDIGIGDEAKYLGQGVNFFRTSPDSSWGPLYSLWYYFLDLFSKDTISLYYFNYKLMTILPCIALFLFLLKIKVTPTLSFYFSFALLISMINLPTWPKVSHFGLTLIFIGLILIHSTNGKNAKLLVALFISLIITYIRPEFILSSMLLFGIIIKRSVKNDFGVKRFMMAIVTTLIFIFLIGIPYSPGRNLTAFGQAYHKYLDLEDRINDDGAKDWNEILSENFGDPKNIVDAILINSEEFINHIEINLSKLPSIYINSIQILLPNKIFPISRLIKILIVLSIIISVFVLLLFNKMNNYRTVVHKGFTEKRDLIIYSLIFSLPPLSSIILYFPRAHYILLLLPLIYLIVAQLIVPLKFNNYIKNLIPYCVLVFLSFFLLPQLSSVINRSNFKNLSAVQSIQNLNLKKRINLLENEGGLNVYLPDNYNWIKLEAKKGNFSEFVDKNKINLIYYSNQLTNSAQLK